MPPPPPAPKEEQGLLQRIEWLFPVKGRWLRYGFLGMAGAAAFVVLPLWAWLVPLVLTWTTVRTIWASMAADARNYTGAARVLRRVVDVGFVLPFCAVVSLIIWGLATWVVLMLWGLLVLLQASSLGLWSLH